MTAVHTSMSATIWKDGVIGHETAVLQASQTAQLPYTRHLLFYPHIARIDVYSDGEAVITNTFIIFFLFLFFVTSQHTLRNNEQTADACMLNILKLLFVAFKFSIFSPLSRSLFLQVFFSTVRFTYPLVSSPLDTSSSSSSLLISSPVLAPSSHQLSPSGWGRGWHCCPWIWRALPTSVPGFLLSYRGRWHPHSKLTALRNIMHRALTRSRRDFFSLKFFCIPLQYFCVSSH